MSDLPLPVQYALRCAMSQVPGASAPRALITHALPFTHWQAAQAHLPVHGIRDRLDATWRGGALLSLLFACPPYAPASIPLPAHYYLCSQTAYRVANAAADALRAQGYRALSHPPLPHRAAALRAGAGVPGRHNLLITPGLGSFIHIQLIWTDALQASEAPDLPVPCACPPDCRRCLDACPTRALTPNGFIAARCIRRAWDIGRYPATMRPHVYNLVGCERCQLACPQNAAVSPVIAPPAVLAACAPHKVLATEWDKDAKRTLAALLGKNMVTRNRLIHAALLCVVNRGDARIYREDIARLTQSINPDTAQLARECLACM